MPTNLELEDTGSALADELIEHHRAYSFYPDHPLGITLSKVNKYLRGDWKSRAEKAEEALREAAETFDLFAADLRSVDAELHAQRIAVAELSAQEARQALSPPNQPQGDR